jgi:hypothetical protein
MAFSLCDWYGVRHARTKRGDRNAVALEFAMQGFSQSQDVRFGGGIDSEVLYALVGQHTGDKQDFAALSGSDADDSAACRAFVVDQSLMHIRIVW